MSNIRACAGFSEHTLRAIEFWRQRASRMEKEAVEEKEKRVHFSPKYRLPVVADYRRDSGVNFGMVSQLIDRGRLSHWCHRCSCCAWLMG